MRISVAPHASHTSLGVAAPENRAAPTRSPPEHAQHPRQRLGINRCGDTQPHAHGSSIPIRPGGSTQAGGYAATGAGGWSITRTAEPCLSHAEGQGGASTIGLSSAGRGVLASSPDIAC